MKYIIMGKPTPLARARHANGHVYDSQKHEKLRVGLHLENQHDDKPKYKGALHMEIIFYFEPSNKKRDLLHGRPHIIKPDTSNLIKFYEDVGNGILYQDDCTIASITAKKLYDKGETRTEIIITEIDDE